MSVDKPAYLLTSDTQEVCNMPIDVFSRRRILTAFGVEPWQGIAGSGAGVGIRLGCGRKKW